MDQESAVPRRIRRSTRKPPLVARTRRPARFEPGWTGSVYEKWARRFLRKNSWRTQYYFGAVDKDAEDEALMECCTIYYKCVERYGRRPNMEARWLMSLFTISVARRWCYLSLADRAMREATDPTDLPPTVAYNEGPLSVAIAEQPEPVREAISLLALASGEVINFIFHKPLTPGAGSEATQINRRIRVTLGVTLGKIDLVGELRGLLQTLKIPR